MNRSNSLALSPQGLGGLKRERARLRRRLSRIDAKLEYSAFRDSSTDINFTLVEQQMLRRRLEELERFIENAKTAGTRAARKQLENLN